MDGMTVASECAACCCCCYYFESFIHSFIFENLMTTEFRRHNYYGTRNTDLSNRLSSSFFSLLFRLVYSNWPLKFTSPCFQANQVYKNFARDIRMAFRMLMLKLNVYSATSDVDYLLIWLFVCESKLKKKLFAFTLLIIW